MFPNRKHWDVSAKDHFVRVCEGTEKMHSCRKYLVRNYRLVWKWLEVKGKAWVNQGSKFSMSNSGKPTSVL